MSKSMVKFKVLDITATSGFRNANGTRLSGLPGMRSENNSVTSAKSGGRYHKSKTPVKTELKHHSGMYPKIHLNGTKVDPQPLLTNISLTDQSKIKPSSRVQDI